MIPQSRQKLFLNLILERYLKINLSKMKCENIIISVIDLTKDSPVVVHTAERQLGCDHIEVDNSIHRHCHGVPGQDLGNTKLTD